MPQHVELGLDTFGDVTADASGALLSHARVIRDVIDEAAMIAALQAGTIAGAGLDVYSVEPPAPHAAARCHGLEQQPNINCSACARRGLQHLAPRRTPHCFCCASGTLEQQVLMMFVAALQVRSRSCKREPESAICLIA